MIITKKENEIQSLTLEIRIEQSDVEYQEKWNQLFAEYFGEKTELSSSTFANSTVILTPEYNQLMIRLSLSSQESVSASNALMKEKDT